MNHAKGASLAGAMVLYILFVAGLTLALIQHPLAPRPSYLGKQEVLLDEGEQEAEATELRMLKASAVDNQTPFNTFAKAHLSQLKWVSANGKPKHALVNKAQYRKLPDFAAIENTAEKKRAFFDYLRPAVEHQNEILLEQRIILKGIEIKLAQGEALDQPQTEFLNTQRKRYKIDQGLPEPEATATLKLHLDSLPEAMVLAQAAIESAWGQSRFALEANNLFGQWCFKPGCGLVPNSRPEGKTYEVRAFDSVEQSIAGYFHNLNTFHRYDGLRNKRAALRAQNKPLSGHVLVGELQHYSTRGEAYIAELRAMIRHNHLE